MDLFCFKGAFAHTDAGYDGQFYVSTEAVLLKEVNI